MGIVLDNLRYTMAKDFLDSFGTRNYYIFASSLTDSDISGNNEGSAKLFIEKTIFGKKILLENVLFMIRKVIWTPGIVYTPYDDILDLSSSSFYVITEPESESGNYHVFKCLSNNNGAASIDMPTYSNGLASQNYLLRTADGYVWKYMYSTTNDTAKTYSTPTLFPVVDDAAVIADAKSGIDKIIVSNPTTNFGYDTRTGAVISVALSDSGGTRTIILNSGESDPVNEYFRINGYYKGYTFYATSSDGVNSRKYTIVDSGVNSNQKFFVSVSNYVDDDNINDTWSYTISPSVEIIGDGTGASATSKIVGGRITDIIIINSGQGYSRSIARIVPPTIGFNPNDPTSGHVTCALRVVPPPPAIYNSGAGHGSNPASELKTRYVAIVSQLNAADEEIIPSTNTYSKIGVVRDPVFDSGYPVVFDNRIKIEISSIEQLSVGDVVTQPSTNFNGIIHTIDSINNTVYVTEFYGPYIQQDSSFYLSGLVPLDDTQPLTTPAGRVEIETGGVAYPVYHMGSGELLYVSEFNSIERSENLSEQFKFIISF